MANKADLFEDIAVAIDSWVGVCVDALTNPAADLQWTEDAQPYVFLQTYLGAGSLEKEAIRSALFECLRGFSVSVLTALDGGTSLAEKGRLYIVDEQGRKIGEGLHGEFVGYLIKTGRL